MTVERRLDILKLELPEPPKPVGAYVPSVSTGNLVFLAGQIPMRDGKAVAKGKLGKEFTAESVGDAVQVATLNGLAALKAEIGDLDRVVSVVKLTGYVASAEGFTDQAKVLNHASELLLAAFGDKGAHARVAIGVAELPLGVPVELELVFEVDRRRASTEEIAPDRETGQAAVEREREVIERRVQKHAESAGLRVTSDAKKLDELVSAMARRKIEHGEFYCMNGSVTGDRDTDRAIICPCEAHLKDIAQDGQCKCGLFLAALKTEERSSE